MSSLCTIITLDCRLMSIVVFFFQAEDGIRDLVRSRGLGDVYKRQPTPCGPAVPTRWRWNAFAPISISNRCCSTRTMRRAARCTTCLLYTSDAADERSSVDLGGRRIITKQKKRKKKIQRTVIINYQHNLSVRHITTHNTDSQTS